MFLCCARACVCVCMVDRGKAARVDVGHNTLLNAVIVFVGSGRGVAMPMVTFF
jgi:hypothetical protein